MALKAYLKAAKFYNVTHLVAFQHKNSSTSLFIFRELFEDNKDGRRRNGVPSDELLSNERCSALRRSTFQFLLQRSIGGLEWFRSKQSNQNDRERTPINVPSNQSIKNQNLAFKKSGFVYL